MSTATDTLSDRAYQHMQKRLLDHEWVAGDVVSEHSVAKELGISRTPVREAFRMLEQEGILEQVPRFGTRVKAVTKRDLAELYELREALEPYAVAQAAGKLTEADAQLLEALCTQIQAVADDLKQKSQRIPDGEAMKKLMSADMAFHQLLIRASGNRRMVKIVAESRMLARIFTTLRQEHDVDVIEQTARYHTDILNAVRAGAGEKARDLMAEHIRASMNDAMEHFDKQDAARAMLSDPLMLPEDMMNDLQKITQLHQKGAGVKRRKTT